MGFSRQEYWNGLPCPSPGDLPDPGIKPTSFMSLALSGGFFITGTTWKALVIQGSITLILWLYGCSFLHVAHQVPVGFPAMPCLTAAGLGLDSDQPSGVSIMNLWLNTHTPQN